MPTPLINYTNSTEGSTVLDEQNPAIKVIIKGKEVPSSIVDRGSRVNVISQATCDQLSIQEWDICPCWLRMANTNFVRPLNLIQNPIITIGGYSFEISAVVLKLDAQGAYPLLLGRPWLRTANIKLNWQKNIISF